MSGLESIAALVGQRASWDQHERDVAAWGIWQAIKASLGAFLPAREPVPAAEVVSLSRLELEDAREQLAESPKLATAFGRWRAAVTEHEATNAGRLQCLGQVVRELSDARLRATQPEAVDQALAQLGDVIARHWGTDVALRGDIRTWARKQTRRPDLLPNAWREL